MLEEVQEGKRKQLFVFANRSMSDRNTQEAALTKISQPINWRVDFFFLKGCAAIQQHGQDTEAEQYSVEASEGEKQRWMDMCPWQSDSRYIETTEYY